MVLKTDFRFTVLQELIIVTSLLVINVVLKSIYIGAQEIALDEPFTIFNAQKPIGDLIDHLKLHNNPPLFEILLHYWIQWFGIDPVSVRFPSMIFSSLAAVVIYFLGKHSWNSMAGIVASILFTFSTFNIYFSHEARAYPLFTLASCTAMLTFMKWSEKPQSISFAIMYFVSAIILIYSHYFGFFVLFAQGIWFLFFLKKLRRHWVIFLISIFALVLAYLPQLFVMAERFADASGTHWVGLAGFPVLYHVLAKLCNAPVPAIGFMLIIAAGGIYYFVNLSRNYRAEHVLLILWFPVMYVLPWLIGLKIPMFLDRYMVFVSPALYILLGGICFGVAPRKSALVFAVACVIAMIASVNLNPGHGRKWKDLVDFVKKEKTTGTVAYFIPHWVDLGFIYHYNLSYFKDYEHARDLMKSENFIRLRNVNDENLLKLDQVEKVILMEMGSEFVDPKGLVAATLRQQFPVVKEYPDIHPPGKISVYSR